MAELVVSVVVPTSPARTWAALVDWDRQGEWMPGTRVRATGRRGVGVGAALSARTGLGPFAVLDTMEITAWDPPRRCEVVHTGRLVRGAGAFEVEPAAGGAARCTWSEWLEPPLGLAGAAGALALRPLVEAALRLSLARFARWVPTLAPRS